MEDLMVILLELTHTMTRILDLPRLTTAYVARTFMNTSVISWFCPKMSFPMTAKLSLYLS